jgi:hypothetical protein
MMALKGGKPEKVPDSNRYMSVRNLEVGQNLKEDGEFRNTPELWW